MFFTFLFADSFCFCFSACNKHRLNLEVKMNFVLSPWVKEEAKGSRTHLSGNVLPWEVCPALGEHSALLNEAVLNG